MSDQKSIASTVKAWDPLIRVFHWSFVFFFVLAFITEDDWLNLHVQAGYALSLLIGFRLFWGLVGTPTARFSNFVKAPKAVLSHLRGMFLCNASHYLGHNPVAAVMVVLLLSSIALVAFSGMVMIASEGQGPLAATFFSSWNGEWMEEVHEFLADFTLLLIFAHVAGVLFSSLLERENLVKAMWTGRKKYRSHWNDFVPQQGEKHET
ncbi:cytochrome b/b6 domain-containing protein [Gammaproteobacteria bacterium]|nr:cytochrome b/b6 domain-containing protein [Gammaproteobacteria bacterium]